jgi:hypothetical protein
MEGEIHYVIGGPVSVLRERQEAGRHGHHAVLLPCARLVPHLLGRPKAEADRHGR